MNFLAFSIAFYKNPIFTRQDQPRGWVHIKPEAIRNSFRSKRVFQFFRPGGVNLDAREAWFSFTLLCNSPIFLPEPGGERKILLRSRSANCRGLTRCLADGHPVKPLK